MPLSSLSELTLECFKHPSNDIHKRALSFLKKTKEIEDPGLAAAVRDRASRLGGLLKKELMEIAARSSAGQAEEIETDSNERTQEFLQAISSKGKAAKLATLLLELPAGEDLLHRKLVAIQILSSRIERAKRWSSFANPARRHARLAVYDGVRAVFG